MARKISMPIITALFVSSLLFIIAFLLGWNMGYRTSTDMESMLERMKTEDYSLEILTLIGGNLSCRLYEEELARMSAQTDEFGWKIDLLEKKKGKMDSDVLSLKSNYALMQARNYLLLQRMRERCNVSIEPIIYFYSNENYTEATDLGIPLMRSKPPNAIIYHFDVNVDNAAVRALRSEFGVVRVPVFFYRGARYEGYKSEEELRKIFGS
ncbi:MAG: hypothetical protein QXP42_02915 [Candidatus Micrarchaeia archaeon]